MRSGGCGSSAFANPSLRVQARTLHGRRHTDASGCFQALVVEYLSRNRKLGVHWPRHCLVLAGGEALEIAERLTLAILPT
jgi:hypothetical protein